MKLNFKLVVITGWVVFCAYPAQADEKLYYIAPSQIPNVTREMKTAGFWVNRHPQPDKILMNSKDIAAFNKRVQEDLKLSKDLRNTPAQYDGVVLEKELLSQWDSFKDKGYFMGNGELADERFFDAMKVKMAIDGIPQSIQVHYGLIARYANQRFFPTNDGLYEVVGDIDFDELQNSALDIGSAVVILHYSQDKKWAYVLSELSDGWVEADNIAFCDWEAFKMYLSSREFVVITDNKVDLYLDRFRRKFYDHVRMGVKLPEAFEKEERSFVVMIPSRTNAGKLKLVQAYLHKSQASRGFLTYTSRTIFEQAFKLLNEPYGWGDMYGEQDCSRFLQEVFATVGIMLARDSKNQAQTGKMVASFEADVAIEQKHDELNKVAGGNSVITMKGHIMLYLGMVDGRPYAIHSLWGYREPSSDGDRVRVINRVAVSDLYLGEDSQKGSLFSRMNGIMEIK